MQLQHHHIYLNPFGQLSLLVLPGESLVGEDHDTVVSLSSQRPSHALGGVTHGVKGEEVALADGESVTQILQTSLENARLGVDIRDAEHEHGAPEMMVKVHSFGYLASCNLGNNGT